MSIAQPDPSSADPAVGGAGKVFCVGLNKTGTTSLAAALRELGYRVADQPEAERLLPCWQRRDFAPIVAFAAGADAFQDIPFSLPFTYQALHAAYPEARFILSLRESAEAWYDSQMRFMVRLYGRVPDAEDLRGTRYGYPGFMYEAKRAQLPELGDDALFDRTSHLEFYERHRRNVLQYFGDSPRFLVLNPAWPDSYARLCRFLDRPPQRERMPHLNRSRPAAPAASTAPPP